MKSFFIMSALAAGAMLLSSCSSEEAIEQVANQGDGNVAFTLELPADVNTRVFGDGFKATTLTFAVYESGVAPIKPIIVSEDEYFFTNLKTTVNFRLAAGKTYDIVFWADAPVQAPNVNPYTFDPATQTISVNYEGVVTNAEDRDAFFAAVKGLKVTGTVNENVRLYRPFAQINLGTNDLAESAVADAYPNLRSAMTTTGYKTLNLLTGAVSDPVAVNYMLDSAPANETFPVAGYDYLSMDYLLVESAKAMIDCRFLFNNGTEQIYTLNVTNVPVQRNYRTNIFGSLLSSEATFTIEIVPPFLEPSNDVTY